MRYNDNDPRNIHRRNGKEEQQAQVRDIAAKVTPLRKADPRRGATRTVWNEYLQRYVEVR